MITVLFPQLMKMSHSSLNSGTIICKKSYHFPIILWELTSQVCANVTSKTLILLRRVKMFKQTNKSEIIKVILPQLKKMTLSSLNCGARSCKKSRHFRIILWEFTCQVCANATSKKQKCKTNWQLGLLLHTTDRGNTMLLLFHRRRWEIPKTC